MVDFIFSTLAVSCVKFDSIEYSKSVSLLFELKDLKNNPSVLVVSPIWVVKPIKLSDLLITNNVCVSPVSGILNVALSPVLDTTILVLPPFVNVTCWFCVNGWLGMNMLWFGIDVGMGIFPITMVDIPLWPDTVPIPNSWVGLKNILSSNFDSKYGVVKGIVNLSVISITSVDAVWIPAVCSVIARITLLSGNKFNTDNLAVPIPIVDPTDMLGIVDTNISVTIPAAVIAGVSAINLVFSEETPITCSPVNFAINVDTPEMTTVSLSSNVCGAVLCKDTSPDLFQIKFTFW